MVALHTVGRTGGSSPDARGENSMLIAYPGGKAAVAPIDVHQTWWLDLIDPTEEEKASAESICRFAPIRGRPQLGWRPPPAIAR